MAKNKPTNDLSSLFDNFSDNQIETQEESQESVFYNVNPKKSKNGKVYNSVIKFVPYFPNIKQSILSKWNAYMVDESTGKKMYVDCPSTINQDSILKEMYFALKNSDNAADQKLKDIFSRKKAYFSLIQILEDENHPELVGKFKILKYGQKIYEKIQKLTNPTGNKKRQNPFDPFEGRPFEFDVKMVSDFPNYDSCEFSIEPRGILVNGEELEKDPENYQVVYDYVMENAPDLMTCQFKPWDENTWKHVTSVIESTVENDRIISRIYKQFEVENFATKAQKPSYNSQGDNPFIEQDARKQAASAVKGKINSIRKESVEGFDGDVDNEDFEELNTIMASSKKSAASKATTFDDANESELYEGL